MSKSKKRPISPVKVKDPEPKPEPKQVPNKTPAQPADQIGGDGPDLP
jgi:hypothetical protein